MSFDPFWLDLRAPADVAARDPALLGVARDHLAAFPDPVALDLGAGTGATPRAVAAPGTRWRLLDRDPRLLEIASARVPQAETRLVDLSDLDALPLAGVRLVTASALLDLAGTSWLDRLADRLAAAEVALYAALSYDGTLAFAPSHADDAAIAAAFNRHQRQDKGLGGPALGPTAAAHMAAALASRGFHVRLAPSAWQLAPGPLMTSLIAGIAGAATEMGAPGDLWRQARAATAGATVGHLDLFALPAGTRAQSNTTSVSSP
jgi:hypothetical protein